MVFAPQPGIGRNDPLKAFRLLTRGVFVGVDLDRSTRADVVGHEVLVRDLGDRASANSAIES
jgi:hypothetical protein